MIILNSLPRWFLAATGGSLLLLCAGCDPKDWVCWAPDGQHAFVQGADNTWLVDGSGKILGKATDARAWLPDSRHVIAVRAVKPNGWDEYAQLLGPEGIERTIEAAGRMRELIRSYQGDWTKFGESEPYKKWEHAEAGEDYNDQWLSHSVALFLKQTDPQVLAPILKTNSIQEQDLLPKIYEVLIRNILPSEPPAEQLLRRFPIEISRVSASPNGNVVAVVAAEPKGPALYVIPVPVSTNSSLEAVDQGVVEADWSTDGQSLVYAKTTVPYNLLEMSLQLGTITSRRVCGSDGQLLAAFEPAKDLAGVLLGQDALSRVACLPDGRILFAAAPIHLPAITADMPSHLTLYALRSVPTPTLESVVRPEDVARLPDRVDCFSLSPDKKKVAMVNKQGHVSVLFLDSGELRPLQEADVYPDTGKYTPLIPNWRNADEVTCVVPVGDTAGSPARAEVVLANVNGHKTAVSKAWPDTAVKGGLLLPNE